MNRFKVSITENRYRDILSKAELRSMDTSIAKSSCMVTDSNFKKFVILVGKHEIMYCFAGIYQQNLMSEMASQVKEIGQVVKETRNLVDEQHLEERNRRMQEYSSRQGRYFLPDSKGIQEEKTIWKLSCYHSYRMFKSEEERKKEILYVTDLWKNERENYPDWYIPPYHICCELKWSFGENQLLQPSKEISLEELLEFAYELVWRYETGMKLYESYERLRLRAIWGIID